MLSYIDGRILVKKDNYLIIVVAGLGYKIFASPKLIAELNGEVELYLYHQVKEDGQALYGFKTLAELEFFEMLLTVSGIGPKSALNILSNFSADNLKEAIFLGNADLLTKAGGIGKKMADKIVLELKSKAKNFSVDESLMSVASDEIDALISLGYSLANARQALGQIDSGVSDSGERIRQALRFLAK